MILLFAALFSPAEAGIGTTAYLSSSSDGTTWVPSVDIRTDGVLLQIHAIDFVGDLALGDATVLPSGKTEVTRYLNVGGDLSRVVTRKSVGVDDVDGVVMPGLAVRLNADTGFESVGFSGRIFTRMGAEMKKGMGFGIYVVPEIGVGNLAGSFGLVYGGGLQVSAWLKK